MPRPPGRGPGRKRCPFGDLSPSPPCQSQRPGRCSELIGFHLITVPGDGAAALDRAWEPERPEDKQGCSQKEKEGRTHMLLCASAALLPAQLSAPRPTLTPQPADPRLPDGLGRGAPWEAGRSLPRAGCLPAPRGPCLSKWRWLHPVPWVSRTSLPSCMPAPVW